MLSHENRRRILFAAAAHDSQRDAAIDSKSVAAEDEYDQFYHTHLPKLDDAGFIEWDSDSGTFTRGRRFGEIEPVLDLLRTHKDDLPGWP
jgi:hypothetical protein